MRWLLSLNNLNRGCIKKIRVLACSRTCKQKEAQTGRKHLFGGATKIVV